jgi:hypothetical protein
MGPEERPAASRYNKTGMNGGPVPMQLNSRTGFFSGFEEDNPYD